MTWNQRFGYAFGVAYLVIGVAGFAVTGNVDFAEADGDELVILELNPLHNVVHLAIGGLLVAAAAAGPAISRSVNIVVGATYLAVGLVGFFIVGNEDLNILALNHPDNWLHVVTAAAALGVGLTEERLQRSPAA